MRYILDTRQVSWRVICLCYLGGQGEYTFFGFQLEIANCIISLVLLAICANNKAIGANNEAMSYFFLNYFYQAVFKQNS